MPAQLPLPAHPPAPAHLSAPTKDTKLVGKGDHDSDGDDTASDATAGDPHKKFMAKMRAKASRLCCRSSTGKLKVSQEIHDMWMKAGKVRDDMVELMADADGHKDSTTLSTTHSCICMRTS